MTLLAQLKLKIETNCTEKKKVYIFGDSEFPLTPPVKHMNDY